MSSLTVIIPFFNEAKYLSQLVADLEKLPQELVTEVIFIDDGSSDDSIAVLEASLLNTTLKTSLHSKANGGKASAIEYGSKFLTTSHVLILDADLELATSDIPRLWEIVLENKSDVVFGYRLFLAQSSFTYRFTYGNKLISHIFGMLYNEVITDIMCGFKLIPSDYLRSIPFRFSKFAVEVEIPLMLWLQRVRPYEIEVAYSPRSRAEGKVIGVKDALQVIFDMLWFRIRMKNKRKRD